MNKIEDLTLRELVERITNDVEYDHPIDSVEILVALHHLLPEIEAAINHAEESGLHSETCCCACCELLRAYRAASKPRSVNGN